MEAVAERAGPRKGRWWVVAGLTVSVAALLVATVELSTEEGGRPKIEVEGLNEMQQTFGGVPQLGNRLGEADAPVTIQIFNDVQCAGCEEQFLATVPSLVEDLVRPGDAKLLYRNYSFSVNPVQQGFIAAEAAAKQGYEWHYVYLFFANQSEAERLGVTGEFLESLAGSIAELDVPQWEEDFAEGGGADGSITRKLEAEDEVARGLGLRAQPSAIVSGPAGSETLQDSPTLGQIEAAVDRVD
jgi:protein-disulfide isomerase